MSTDVKRRTALPGGRAAAAVALVLAVALALPLALPLASAGPAAAAGKSPGQRIAAALRTDPVYVDAGYANAVPKARQRELTARIRATKLPLYVVLVPLAKGDPWGGEPRQLATVVHDRLGVRDAIILTTGDFGADSLAGFEWPQDTHQAREAASAVGLEDAMEERPLGERVARAVELIDTGKGAEAYDRATAELDEPRVPATSRTKADGSSGSGPSAVLIAVIAVAAVVLLGGAVLLAGRRLRGRGGAGEPFASPRAVFAAAREADEAELRRRAQEEVVALGEATAAAGPAAAAGSTALARALDAYAAAGTVLDAARGRADLAGVLALVAEGRDALREHAGGAPAPLPLCFFNPLHGRAARTVDWRPVGRRERLTASACTACAKAVKSRRTPEVLTDTYEGRTVPYFEVPAAHSLWAATGYGSLTREGLAAPVSRGEFSRTRGV